MISKISEQVYIGDQVDAISEELYNIYKFDEIINLNNREDPDELKLVKKYNIGYVNLGHPQKEKGKAAGYLYGAVQNGKKILVHCEAGIDRAPFVVAQYLAMAKKIQLNKAYNIVKYFRPQTIEHFEWV